MDRYRYSYIAHGRMPVWNPISLAHLDRYIARLEIPAGAAVLDIGCGCGGVLARFLSRCDATGIGVEPSPYAAGEARRRCADLMAAGRLVLVERIYEPADFDAASFELVLCIGSTHAAGGYQATLAEARRLLKPGGWLLIGEGYWRRTPPQAYLDFLQTGSDAYFTHENNGAAGIEHGFDLASSSECSFEEWDAYEDTYAQNVESFVESNPDDPDASAMLERIRPWREAFLRWGRDTLGFGLYLFNEPVGPTTAKKTYESKGFP